MSTAAGTPRPLPSTVIRGVWGTALLLAPHAVLGAVAHGRVPAAAGRVLRALGVRHLAQAALLARRPTAGVFALAAVTDALHASSALAMAAADRRWRTASALDAVVAAGFGLAAARQARVRSC
jgi:hypothetical protein